MRTWKDVATLIKPKNLNGRFVARAAADLPFLLELGHEVAFVPPKTDLPRRGTVNYIRDNSDGSFEVGFDSVHDESTAHGLAGSHCLVRRAEIEERLAEELLDNWDGWQVIGTNGSYIGVVLGVIDNPAQSLLEVDRGNDLPIAYIPIVEEFIVKVDDDSQSVIVELPEGLLTINE